VFGLCKRHFSGLKKLGYPQINKKRKSSNQKFKALIILLLEQQLAQCQYASKPVKMQGLFI